MLNIYFWIILGTWILTALTDAVAEALNLRALSTEIPSEFSGAYNPEQYRKSQEYTRVKTRFGWVVKAVTLAATWAFWWSGGFGWIDDWARSLGWPMIPTGLAFTGALMLLSEVISWPFDVYGTFVIEERFGFNKMTWKTFVADKIKGLVLTALIGGALLSAILAFFHYAGPRAWLYGWIATAVFIFLLQWAAPTLIMPLFNKFKPLEDGELKKAIFDYAGSVGFPLQNIFVMDGSKRSTKTNAFFTGFGKQKRIVLFDTLVEKHTVPELIGVLAHEIGHYMMKHIKKGIVISIAQVGLMFFLLSFFIREPGLFAAFRVDEVSPYAGLFFFGMLYAPISFILGIFLMMFSRHNEYEADRYSVHTTPDKEELVKALKTVAVSNLANLTPHPFYVFLHYSHPPMLERIRAIRAESKT